MTIEQKANLIALLMDFKMGKTDMDAVIYYCIMHWKEK